MKPALVKTIAKNSKTQIRHYESLREARSEAVYEIKLKMLPSGIVHVKIGLNTSL